MSARATLLLATVALLPACTGRVDAPPPAAGTAEPDVVALAIAGQDFQAPDTIPAGWTTFRFANHGDEIHYAHVVRLEPGRTVQELVDAYAEAIRRRGARPTWVTRFGGPGGTAPGDSSGVTQYLEPGPYVWICPIEDAAGVPHFTRGEVHPFVVAPAGPDAADRAAPEATAVIRLVDHAFELDPAPAAGRHTFRVENAGTEPHDVALLRLAPGRTLEDVRAWLQDGQGAPPAAAVGSVAAIAPGMQAWFDADLAPGEYLLVCFVTAPDGRTHIEHGMIRPLRVG